MCLAAGFGEASETGSQSLLTSAATGNKWLASVLAVDLRPRRFFNLHAARESRILLMPEGFDGVHFGGAHGGIDAEDHADQAGNGER